MATLYRARMVEMLFGGIHCEQASVLRFLFARPNIESGEANTELGAFHRREVVLFDDALFHIAQQIHNTVKGTPFPGELPVHLPSHVVHIHGTENQIKKG